MQDAIEVWPVINFIQIKDVILLVDVGVYIKSRGKNPTICKISI
jgi:hypothetical protein